MRAATLACHPVGWACPMDHQWPRERVRGCVAPWCGPVPAQPQCPCHVRRVRVGFQCSNWGSTCFKGHFPWKQAGWYPWLKYCSISTSILKGAQLLPEPQSPRYSQVPPDIPRYSQILPGTLRCPVPPSLPQQLSRRLSITVVESPSWTQVDTGIPGEGGGGQCSAHLSAPHLQRPQIPSLQTLPLCKHNTNVGEPQILSALADIRGQRSEVPLQMG